MRTNTSTTIFDGAPVNEVWEGWDFGRVPGLDALQEMRDGDFRGLVDSGGRPIQLYDPMTTDPTTWQRQPLSYRGIPNMIDPARITKLAKTLFGATPLPNLPSVNPLVDFNWIGPTKIP